MHHQQFNVFLCLLLLLFCMACGGKTADTEQPQAPIETEATNTPNPKEKAVDLGVKAGDLIAENDRLEAGKLRNGEGEFDVFYLKSKSGQRIGFVMEDFDAPGKVGDIFITNSGTKVPGARGITVGQHWSDLRAAFPDIEAYGSEIEARTYAITDQMSFRLNVANSTYELDEASIPATTSITEILIKAPR